MYLCVKNVKDPWNRLREGGKKEASQIPATWQLPESTNEFDPFKGCKD